MPVLKPEQLVGLDVWLRSILWDSNLPTLGSDQNSNGTGDTDANFEIHRLKARLPLSNGDVKIVQAVREVFEIIDAPKPEDASLAVQPLEGKIVLIGRHLVDVLFEESFINTIKS